MKVSYKTALAVCLVSLLSLTAISVFTYSVVKERMVAEKLHALDAIATIQENRIAAWNNDRLERLAIIASRYQLRVELAAYLKNGAPATLASINKILDAALSYSSANVRKIFVLDPRGIVAASTDRQLIGTDFSKEEFYLKGIKGPVVNILVYDSSKGVLGYNSTPLRLDGAPLGVIVLETAARNIIAITSDYTGLGSTGETLIAERAPNGDALYINPLRFDPAAALRRTQPKSQANTPITLAMLNDERTVVEDVDYRGVKVLAATRYVVETGWGLVVKQDADEALSHARYLRKVYAGFTGIVAVIVLYLSVWLGRAISRPVSQLRDVAVKISGGDRAVRTSLAPGDEFHALGEAFNKMADDLIQANEHLEEKVRERTMDLEAEIEERKATEDNLRVTQEDLEAEIEERMVTEDNLRVTQEELEASIEEHKATEDNLKITQQSLEKSLSEKEMLVREVHHRVKNNLAVIQSLLSPQASSISDEKTKGLLDESRNRVRAMGMIHESLYKSPNLTTVNFSEYLRALVMQVFRSYRGAGLSVKLRMVIPDVTLDINTIIPCGLIVNELVTNALKYAFPGGRIGELFVGIEGSAKEGLALIVKDDGVGMPDGLDLDESQSLGMRIISSLSGQIGARVEIVRDHGTIFRLIIPPQKTDFS